MKEPFRIWTAHWRAWRAPRPYQYWALREQRKPILPALILLLAAVAITCWLHPVNTMPVHHAGEWIRIPANEPNEVELLTITATQFWWEEILGDDGRPTVGLTANLILSPQDQPDQHMDVRVHAGQAVEYNGYQVKIKSVGGDTAGQCLVFKVTQLTGLPAVFEIGDL